jgi:hypothetical protein
MFSYFRTQRHFTLPLAPHAAFVETRERIAVEEGARAAVWKKTEAAAWGKAEPAWVGSKARGVEANEGTKAAREGTEAKQATWAEAEAN